MLSSDTRGRPGFLPLHKHPVSILVWCVFLKPCMKLTLHLNHRSGLTTIFYYLRFEAPKPGGPGPRIYVPQKQVGQIMPPGTGFPFHRLLRLAGLRRRLSTRQCVGSPDIASARTQRIQLPTARLSLRDISSIACMRIRSHVTYLRKCVSELLPRNLRLCWLHN
jgi:hypothetical protein